MKLYEIAHEYESILSSAIDSETGEVDVAALAKLNEVKSDMQAKSIALASYIKNMEAERDAIEKAKKNMAERENALDKRLDYLTQYLQSNMELCGINEIKCSYFNIKLKKCPISTNILDEGLVPEEYKKYKMAVTIDKLKIKEEILAGVVIPGVELKQKNRLEIK